MKFSSAGFLGAAALLGTFVGSGLAIQQNEAESDKVAARIGYEAALKTAETILAQGENNIVSPPGSDFSSQMQTNPHYPYETETRPRAIIPPELAYRTNEITEMPAHRSTPDMSGRRYSDSSEYQGSFGTRYQYDLSDPSDAIRYSMDPSAKLNDSISLDPRVDLDRSIGQYGGGIVQ